MKILLVLLALTASPKDAPTKNDFENVLKKITTSSKEMFDLKSYESMEFIHKESKEKKKFSDLSLLEQNLFCVIIADYWEKDTALLSKAWEQELQLLKNPNNVPILGKDQPATEDDVKNYIIELEVLRKEIAIKYETWLEKMLISFEKEISKEEREYCLKTLKSKHDKLLGRTP